MKYAGPIAPIETKVKNVFAQKKFIIGLIVMGGVVCGSITGAFLALTHDLPQIRSLEDYRPSAVTRIFSADGVMLAELFLEKRDPVPLETIPHHLKAALVATEDRNFYHHGGVDLKGILRAILKDIQARKFVEGASTITQQIAKTLFLTPKKTLSRKLKEVLLAFQLERRYTKDEILELYLNQVYFGSGAYGVESAAKIFFGKSVDALSLAECALVAGMPKSPSRYSPLVNKALSTKRRNIVLKQMLVTGIITEEQYHQAVKAPIHLVTREPNRIKAPYFVEYVKRALEKDLGSSLLYKGGLTVHTTLSYAMQQAAESAVAKGLHALEKRMKQQQMQAPYPQCALIALDVGSGGVLAMIGGRNFYQSPFNRATKARRQPGSAFKPLVYAHAIERGFAQNMMLLDAPAVFRGARRGKDWRPENFSRKYRGEITLRRALAFSENIPAVRLIEMLGPSSVAQFAHALGIQAPLAPNLSLALGTSEVTLLHLTSAYTVFPNHGEKVTPRAVMEVIDHRGRIIRRVKPQRRVVMSRVGAAIMTDMLQSVIKEGTGRKARVLRQPVAGKTGTTNEFRDALFIGFSPTIAAGVWMGQDAFVTLGKGETGARAALPIWVDFMSKAVEDRACHYFDIPDDVVRVRMDPATGSRADADSPGAENALFKKGTEPRRR